MRRNHMYHKKELSLHKRQTMKQLTQPESIQTLFIKSVSEKLNFLFQNIYKQVPSQTSLRSCQKNTSAEDEKEVSQIDSEESSLNNHSILEISESKLVPLEQSQNICTQIKEYKKMKMEKENLLTGKPKKPVSSFVFFYQDQIKNKAQRYGNAAVAKMAKIISNQWKNLPQEQKFPYYRKSQLSKQKYYGEMDSYNKIHANQIQQIQNLKRMTNNKLRILKRRKKLKKIIKKKIKTPGHQEESDQEQENKKKYKRKKKKAKSMADGKEKVKSGNKALVSSFFLFFKSESKKISELHNEHQRMKLAKIASEIWKNMPVEEKEKYEIIARQNRHKYSNNPEAEIERERKAEEKKREKERKKRKGSDDDQSFRYHEKKRRTQAKSNGEQQENQSRNENPKSSKDQEQKSQSEKDSLGEEVIIDSDSFDYSQIAEDSENKEENKVVEGLGQDDLSLNSEIKQIIIAQQIQSNQEDLSNSCSEIVDEQEIKKYKKTKKIYKDNKSHKPKCPTSPFLLYYQSIVADLRKQHPQKTGRELAKVASESWQFLSNLEKQNYKQQIKKRREVYVMQMQKFKTQYPAQAAQEKYFKKRFRLEKLQQEANQ